MYAVVSPNTKLHSISGHSEQGKQEVDYGKVSDEVKATEEAKIFHS